MNRKLLLFQIIITNYIGLSTSTGFQFFSDDPDIDRNTTEVITSRGFRSEVHSVITTDGYILTVFRIINPYVDRNISLRPIYLQHGLGGNSDNWILNTPGFIGSNGVYIENNLINNCSAIDPDSVASNIGFVLSACGYDVWMGNNRGNRYSPRHLLLNPDIDMKYWSFNIDHLSAYDVTAIIEHIRKVTNSDTIGYIGHSLGTTMMFQLLSAQPEYSMIIRPYIALAPVAYVGNIETTLFRIGAFYEPILASLKAPIFGVSSSVLTLIDEFIGRYVCGNTILVEFCEIFLSFLNGPDNPNLNAARIPAALGHVPDGTSALVLAHLAQRVNEKTFNYFDYGISENNRIYGQPKPPKYNLANITSRNIILISGANDYLADPTDVDLIRAQLTVPLYDDYVIQYPHWNHIDFLLGLNAGKYMMTRILRSLMNFG